MKTLVALLASTWVTMTVVSTLEDAHPIVVKSEVQRPVVLWKPIVTVSTPANSVNADSAFPTIQHCVEMISAENLKVQSDVYRF
jgi:hypothetical protein